MNVSTLTSFAPSRDMEDALVVGDTLLLEANTNGRG